MHGVKYRIQSTSYCFRCTSKLDARLPGLNFIVGRITGTFQRFSLSLSVRVQAYTNLTCRNVLILGNSLEDRAVKTKSHRSLAGDTGRILAFRFGVLASSCFKRGSQPTSDNRRTTCTNIIFVTAAIPYIH